ncbi:MAG: hypothetical protein GF310_10850 [candidate division Zixibacteria bacterium]|nr:hypothetical protein [candidate division Zixibacteria bacterium]
MLKPKTLSYWIAGMILYLTMLLFSCTNSLEPDIEDIVELEPLEGEARNIVLHVYDSDSRYFLGELELNTEGSITISYEPLDEYFIYASAEGFFTEIYYCNKGESIDVDLDSCPQFRNTISSSIFVIEPKYTEDAYGYYPDHPYAELPIIAQLPNGNEYRTQTDEQGRFCLGNLPDGIIDIRMQYGDISRTISMESRPEGYYDDYQLYNGAVSYAPNIYLYPDKEMDVDLKLIFPRGGYVIKSEPEYNNGWSVHVTPDGLIDGKYPYLFYESALPSIDNSETGWIFESENLRSGLTELLSGHGFRGHEIDDFLEFWLPILNRAPCYAFYPQDIEQLTILDIQPFPATIIRFHLYVEPLQSYRSLDEPPHIYIPERNGFTVVEWGVIGSPDLVPSER